MKVIKAEDVPQTKEKVNAPDAKKIAEMQEKFDSMKQLIDTKSYGVFLDAELSTYFFNELYPNIQWKGYESYAVSESHDRIADLKQEDGTVNGKVRPEIVEAIFHFIKNYVGTGIETARLFKRTADQFAITIQEINTDRQELKDISLELIAVEKGISIEQLTGELQRNPEFLDK
jgi:hypothetical protein